MKPNNLCPNCGAKTILNRAIFIHVCKCGFMGYINAPVNAKRA